MSSLDASNRVRALATLEALIGEESSAPAGELVALLQCLSEEQLQELHLAFRLRNEATSRLVAVKEQLLESVMTEQGQMADGA